MSVCLPSDKLPGIKQLALALLQRHPIMVHQVLSFVGKTTFCASEHASCVMSFRVTC